MNFFRRTGILEEKGESDGDKKSLLFTENVAVFAYQPSKTTSSVFQSHQESREAFWHSAKKQCAFEAVSKKYTIYFTIDKSREDVIFNNLLIEGETFEWQKLFSAYGSLRSFFY